MSGTGIRVLHVLGTLDRGGIETWLVQVMRQLPDIQFDFAVYEDREYDLSAEVKGLGGRIVSLGNPSNPIRFMRNLKRCLSLHGPYSVVHSHLNETSALVHLVTKAQGIKIRVSHSHIERRHDTLKRVMLYAAFRGIVNKVSTHLLACSVPAGETVFGAGRFTVLHCGITPPDVSGAHTRIDKANLGLGGRMPVVGHVGRFDYQKNQEFLLDVFPSLLEDAPDAVAVLVGRGVLEESIRHQAHELGIRKNVEFLGVRDDVIDLMYSVFDVFAFPSRFEGLGIVLLEAQASGLPCVISDTVPPEVILEGSRVVRLSLDDPSFWARTILELSSEGRPPPVDLTGTSFDIAVSSRSLAELYSASPLWKGSRYDGN